MSNWPLPAGYTFAGLVPIFLSPARIRRGPLRKSRFCLLTLAVVLLALVGRAQAKWALYATGKSATGQGFDSALYIVNTTTGVATPIGNLPNNFQVSAGGLAYDAVSDTMFATGSLTGANVVSRLFIIDRFHPLLSKAFAIGMNSDYVLSNYGLAINPATGVMLATGEATVGTGTAAKRLCSLFTIDDTIAGPTVGTATFVTSTNLSTSSYPTNLYGLGFDQSGVLFANGTCANLVAGPNNTISRLFIVAPSGVATVIGLHHPDGSLKFGGELIYSGLAFDHNGNLFSLGNIDASPTAALFSVAPGTGAATVRGSSVTGTGQSMDAKGGLAFASDSPLFVKDNSADTGIEPNPSPPPNSDSPDIWVRTVPDTSAGHLMFAGMNEDAQFQTPSKTNYVYVSVRNRDVSASTAGETLHLYWAKLDTSLGWPNPWDGTVTVPGATTLMGNEILPAQSLPSIPAKSTLIMEFPWNPPNPAAYANIADPNQFSLLARIVSDPLVPDGGMTFPEGPNVSVNVRNNNHIVWKNVAVIDRPVVTSVLSAKATVCRWFAYQIAATNLPTSYNATNLPLPGGPGGLALDTSTGLITGRPVQANSFAMGLTAKNAVGVSNTATLKLDVIPSSAATRLLNLSTRGDVIKTTTIDEPLIGGFIITGTSPKKVLIRGIGPSLPVPGALPNPTLELNSAGTIIATNDNWKVSDTGGSQQAEIQATTIPPTDDAESAIVATLPASCMGTAYTAILRDNTGGIGLVEVYDLDQTVDSELAQISTRGYADTGDNAMIGGFIVAAPTTVLVRAIGPSLPASVNNRLGNPTLELFDQSGTSIAFNDDWKSPDQAVIEATGIPPSDDKESAILQTLGAGAFTAIVRDKNNTAAGVALVEVYNL